MEISGSNYQNFKIYPANSGNNINVATEGENRLYTSDILNSEFGIKEVSKIQNQKNKRKKRTKNKRLNTIDSDYLLDDAVNLETEASVNENFFIEKEENQFFEKLKKAFEFFYTSIPLINYFFLQKKKYKIKETVEKLNNITQDVDELLNTAVPYGEESNVYNDITQNLTHAANIIGKANQL